MSTIRERDAAWTTRPNGNAPSWHRSDSWQVTAVDRRDLLMAGDALAEAAAAYAEYVQPFADHAGMTSLRAAIANWKAVVDQ